MTLANGETVGDVDFWLEDRTPPTVSANPGSRYFEQPFQVTLTASEAGNVYYTTAGSTPGPSSPNGASPVTLSISATTTLKFSAVDGWNNGSPVVTEQYTFKDETPPTVAANPKTGDYNIDLSVTLSSNESGASIYYTLNGSTPSASSTKYTGPISIDGTTTLRFVAIDEAGNSSAVGSETYTFPNDRTPPTVTPKPVVFPDDSKNRMVENVIGLSLRQ